MSKRYFTNESKPKPGVISPELREAINLHEDKLPIWIYRMRVLGYPPGWLQHATVNTLAIFDGNGEDGELNESSASQVQEYNKEALIEFPGFNTPVPKGDWYFLRMPPMLPTQQLNEALKTMKVSEPVPYKRTKLDISFSSPKPSTSSTPKLSSNHNSRQTSLDESPLSPIQDKKPSITSDSDNTESNEELSKSDCFKTPSKTSNISLNESTDSERKMKLISMGSPMPASERPKRPSLEKWAVGMGELLYFENPNTEYTGVYKNKMKGLIDKIRQKHTQT